MGKQKPNSISIPEQILDTLFSNLENQEGFNKDLIKRLRDLAECNELIKSEKVSDVLKITEGGNDETH
jgi:hypothetical protein